MHEFKQDQGQDALSSLQHYSEDELSLLNSRKRPVFEHEDCRSQTERQNEQEIREFKREIEERFKVSIANKIYTFPKVIQSITDIISSDEENPLQIFKKNQLGDISNFKKQKYLNSTQNYLNDTLKPFESGTLKEGRTVDTKKGKEKGRNSSCRKRQHDSKQKKKVGKVVSGKKKTDRLKTEQDFSGSFMETLRSKAEKKN